LVKGILVEAALPTHVVAAMFLAVGIDLVCAWLFDGCRALRLASCVARRFTQQKRRRLLACKQAMRQPEAAMVFT
jgi:hypothetical protein